MTNFAFHYFSEVKKYDKGSKTTFEHIKENKEIKTGWALFTRWNPLSEFMQAIRDELQAKGSKKIKEYFTVEDFTSRVLRGQIRQRDSLTGKIIKFRKICIPSLSDKPNIYERWVLRGWILNKNYKDIKSWDELLNSREKLITHSISFKECKNMAMKLQKILQSMKTPLAKIEFKVVLCLEKEIISKDEAKALLEIGKVIPKKINVNEYIKETLELLSDQEKRSLLKYLKGSTSLEEANKILEKIDMYYKEKRVTPSPGDRYRLKREFMKALFKQLRNKEA